MLRKCWYNGSESYFHGVYQVAQPIEPSPFQGGHPGGQVAYPVAVLEQHDGYLICADIKDVRFVHPMSVIDIKVLNNFPGGHTNDQKD